MPDLVHQRCRNHMLREAVARCPECGRFFCRECITEHEDRVLCASCIRNKIKSSSSELSRLSGFTLIIQFLLGGMLLWIFFYYLGQILLTLPFSFHEGTLWDMGWWNSR